MTSKTTRPRTPRRTSTTSKAAPRSSARRSSLPVTKPTGVVRVNARGFGFVDMGTTSAFVPPSLLRGFLDSDLVEVTAEAEADGRFIATALELKERPRTRLVGTVIPGAPTMLHPDPHVANSDWPLVGFAAPGANVVALIEGKSVRVERELGALSDPSAITERVLERTRVLPEYELPAAPKCARKSAARRDLRKVHTITIDAPYSADLDDALSVSAPAADGSIRVSVHIADVAEHVTPGTELDDLARARATSVYLPGSNIPMLPRELSEDLLSLLPGVERDALTVELRVTDEGVITSTDVFETRIASDQRLSYEVAADVLAGKHNPEALPDSVTALRHLRTVGARLGLQRSRRGGVEARRVEPELSVTLTGGVVATTSSLPSNPAHLLIERLMVAANEALAHWLLERGLPGLFRVHPEPAPAAAGELELFASHLGFHPGFGPRLTPLSLAAFEAQLAASADARTSALWDVMLGHLGRAEYTPRAGLHFGLASDAYLHFTSPLRRYADLEVHRVVKAYLRGERDASAFPEDLESLAAHVNERSGSAKRAEVNLRSMLLMSTLDPKAEVRARVTGINPRGLRLVLEGTFLSAAASFEDLKGTWAVEGSHRASTRGRTIELGEVLTLFPARIDLEAGTLDLGEARPSARTSAPKASTERPSRTRKTQETATKATTKTTTKPASDKAPSATATKASGKAGTRKRTPARAGTEAQTAAAPAMAASTAPALVTRELPAELTAALASPAPASERPARKSGSRRAVRKATNE
jgi:ribonuclease R